MAGAAVPIMIAKARRRILGYFESAGAYSPESAIAFTPRGRRIDQRMFRRMRDHGALVETAPGRFYLDDAGLARFRTAMRKRAFGAMALVGAVAAVAAALG